MHFFENFEPFGWWLSYSNVTNKVTFKITIKKYKNKAF